MIILYYIINQKRNDFMEHCSPPPVTQDATYTKHVYQHSKHYVGVGSCIKGGEPCCRGKKQKMWLFDHCCFLLILVFFGIFFALFCMKIDKFLLFFPTKIYLCKELSILINFSRISVFLHISNSPATIAYPCNTPILFIRISVLLSGLLLLGYVTS